MSALRSDNHTTASLRVAGLFAGIGGIELGLQEAGHHSSLLCELDPSAQRVLAAHFPGVPLHDDVTTLQELPEVELVAAGFPCQDLSQAGRTAGMAGSQSSLVEHVFRLLDGAGQPVPWLLLENVPFMLQLERGDAMRYLTTMLDERGYTWAYRVVDTRAFGLPQRRQRVLLLASRIADPRPVLFAEDAGAREATLSNDSFCGFYWTEGLRGLGWAVDAVPTLKRGSTLGIPSPPAVWRRGAEDGPLIGTPEIRDAERLQGFDADWTAAAVDDPKRRNGPRWKLVGNAVSVPVARWLGERLLDQNADWSAEHHPRKKSGSWPAAAWGRRGEVYSVEVSPWPRQEPFDRLGDFVRYPMQPLTTRATAGFYERTQRSSLRFPTGFIAAIREHHEATERLLRAA